MKKNCSNCGCEYPQVKKERKVKPVALTIPVLFALAACVSPKQNEPPASLISPVVLVKENATVPNIVPPTRLDIAMVPPFDNWVERCNNMGGEPIEDPLARNGYRYICEGVDY